MPCGAAQAASGIFACSLRSERPCCDAQHWNDVASGQPTPRDTDHGGLRPRLVTHPTQGPGQPLGTSGSSSAAFYNKHKIPVWSVRYSRLLSGAVQANHLGWSSSPEQQAGSCSRLTR
jgi:hypothetical protein